MAETTETPGSASASPDTTSGLVNETGVTQHLLGCLLVLFALIAVIFPVVNTDIWWHLAAGRAIFEQGGFLYEDPFSLTALGRPWIDLHWLFQVVAWLAFKLGGLAAIVILKSTLFGLAAFILLKAGEARARGRQCPATRAISVAFLALIVVAARELVLARPIIISLVCMSLFFYLLERFRTGARPRLLLWLLVIQVVWANSQPLFILGPLIVFVYLLGEGISGLAQRWGFKGFEAVPKGRKLAWLAGLFFALLIVSLVTPYGLDGLRLPFKLLGRIEPGAQNLFAYNVSENIPPWVLERSGNQTAVFFRWLAVVTLASFLLRPKRIALTRLALVAAFFVLALMANRNILLFLWVAGLVLPANVGSALENRRPDAGGRVFWRLATSPLLAVICIAALAASLIPRLAHLTSIARPAPFREPTRAIAALESLPSSGNLFNSVRHGGYLIFHLYPRRLPFIDGRLVLRTAEEFSAYLDVLDRPESFTAYALRHDLEFALLPVAQPDRYRGLIGHLLRSADWRLVFTDGTNVVFSKDVQGLETVDLSSLAVVQKIASAIEAGPCPDIARLHLGLLLVEAGLYNRAREVLEKMQTRDGRRLLARAYYLDRRPGGARKIALQLLESDPRDVESLVLLSAIAAGEGNLPEAIWYAEQALEIDPYHAGARQILSGMLPNDRVSTQPGEEAGP